MSARLTDQQKRDRALSEADLRKMADEIAEILGWVWMTVGPLRTAHGWRTATRGPLGAGWPDTLYLHPRSQRLVLCEFKRELGKTSPDQDHVLGILRAAGLEVYVVRPSSFDLFVKIIHDQPTIENRIRWEMR